jgi:putative ABC transport system substrate-binding protein
MRRRDFIASLATIAAVWPFAARAQPTPVVGLLSGARPESFTPSAPLGAALRDGLTELGFVEGKNFVFEYGER